MRKRLTYEAPEAELILVRFEDNFLDSLGEDNQRSLNFGSSRGAGADPSYHPVEGGDF